jgi:hypothetical protein
MKIFTLLILTAPSSSNRSQHRHRRFLKTPFHNIISNSQLMAQASTLQ